MSLHPDLANALARERQGRLLSAADRYRLARQVPRSPGSRLGRLLRSLWSRTSPVAVGAGPGPVREGVVDTDGLARRWGSPAPVPLERCQDRSTHGRQHA